MADNPGTTGGAGINLVEEDDAALNSTINTTPLVDIMLVLLIIFLITVPVVVSAKEVELPEEPNKVVETKPENLNVIVDSDGLVFLNTAAATDAELMAQFSRIARIRPDIQPEVHIRGDLVTEYYHVGRVVELAQRAGVLKIGFITRAPPPRL
jgi:biopolymer transport protein ExbD